MLKLRDVSNGSLLTKILDLSTVGEKRNSVYLGKVYTFQLFGYPVFFLL